MRSYGQLWEKIVDGENLRRAWLRVRRGHSESPSVVQYGQAVDENLKKLGLALAAGTYEPAPYRQFRIFDPKPRMISCASVEDRIVHHALCDVITPLLERSFVPVSFACRKGFGAHAACALARRYAGRARYFCKMDIRHYFDSVSHDRLLGLILPKFRENRVRALMEMIVRHPVPGQTEGVGLPIGNLTSQWFANAFLDAFDHAALAGFGGRKPIGYLRYMDDFVFFCDSKAECWRLHDVAAGWLSERRGLSLKDAATVVAPVFEGVPFLGLRIWPNCWRLRRSRFVRTRRTFAGRVRQLRSGEIDESRFVQCAVSSDGASRWFGFKGILGHLASEKGSGSNRVQRGGSWNNNAQNCRSANRNNNNPSNCNNNIGFRLVSTVSGQTGSHSETPVLRGSGDKHACGKRPVASANATLPYDGDNRGRRTKFRKSCVQNFEKKKGDCV